MTPLEEKIERIAKALEKLANAFGRQDNDPRFAEPPATPEAFHDDDSH